MSSSETETRKCNTDKTVENKNCDIKCDNCCTSLNDIDINEKDCCESFVCNSCNDWYCYKCGRNACSVCGCEKCG